MSEFSGKLTIEDCLQRAAQAERIAATVSYGKDRESLLLQAAEWRAKAAGLATRDSNDVIV